MKYNATTQRQILLPISFLVLAVSITNWNISTLKWLSLTVFVITILIAFIKYKVELEKHKISYTIQLFGFKIFKKEVSHTDITEVIFKRTGWNDKLAVIKVKKGLPIRVAFFKPDEIFRDLIIFCEENKIHHEKTKDYKIIDNMV